MVPHTNIGCVSCILNKRCAYYRHANDKYVRRYPASGCFVLLCTEGSRSRVEELFIIFIKFNEESLLIKTTFGGAVCWMLLLLLLSVHLVGGDWAGMFMDIGTLPTLLFCCRTHPFQFAGIFITPKMCYQVAFTFPL